ncbi:MAG: TraM recognition domain-containing protein, partial [bacterium]|nr:TraM recognition domain-containing protein [bacterium]
VDEFQNFATDSFASILSEARKYRLSLILAHQYIEQLDEKVQPAVFGNVGTLACFRVGGPDAEFLEKEFLPEFEGTDLVNLEKYNIYLKLLIDGMAGRPFSATVLPPRPTPSPTFGNAIIENSRKAYALPKAEVEEKIASEWLASSLVATQAKVSKRWDEGRERAPRGRSAESNAIPRTIAARPSFETTRVKYGRQEDHPEIRPSVVSESKATFKPSVAEPVSQPIAPARESVLAKLQRPKPQLGQTKKNPDLATSEKEAEKLRQALRERLRDARKEK